MTTAYAIRHPWFSMSSNKRKLPPSPSSSSSDDDIERVNGRSRQFVGASRKRRRCSTLERGFAHLTIHHPIPQTNAHASLHPSLNSSNPSLLELPNARTPSPVPMDLEDTYPIVHPTSIEEPTSPDVSILSLPDEPNDIKMKSQSWYEPEKDRIVITDLDDSDDETDTKSTSNIDISTALLDRIKGHRTHASTPVPLPSASNALVLFRPLIFNPGEVIEDTPEEAANVVQLAHQDDDAMEIEP